ncbi:MAG: peptidoglycan-binding protein [Acidobacteria bacterium]|nr:peptidoglycan-binding protein [Acidobacteriota bacterium]
MKRWIETSALLISAILSLGGGQAQSATTRSKTKPTSAQKSARRKHPAARKGKHSKKASWRRGQQKMDSERARQVQEALIREHYLAGDATGVWDQRSADAMVRYQAANGWQTKIVPDSRALIKLGLGPRQDHLLNPESAMTSPLEPTSTGPRGSSDPTLAVPASPRSTEPTSNPEK